MPQRTFGSIRPRRPSTSNCRELGTSASGLAPKIHLLPPGGTGPVHRYGPCRPFGGGGTVTLAKALKSLKI